MKRWLLLLVAVLALATMTPERADAGGWYGCCTPGYSTAYYGSYGGGWVGYPSYYRGYAYYPGSYAYYPYGGYVSYPYVYPYATYYPGYVSYYGSYYYRPGLSIGFGF